MTDNADADDAAARAMVDAWYRLLLAHPVRDGMIWTMPGEVRAAIDAMTDNAAALAAARESIEAIPAQPLSYPSAPDKGHIEHDEDCVFAYGNMSYPCRCFVRRSTVLAALGAEPTDTH